MVEISIIQQAVIIAMIVVVIYSAMQEGEALSFIDLLTWNWPAWVRKPLCECLKCMTLWWGLLIIVLVGGSFVAVIVATGINILVGSIFEYGTTDPEGNN